MFSNASIFEYPPMRLSRVCRIKVHSPPPPQKKCYEFLLWLDHMSKNISETSIHKTSISGLISTTNPKPLTMRLLKVRSSLYPENDPVISEI